MAEFKTTLIMVAIMLAYAIPGFLLIKVKAVKSDHISSFSKLLMFVCQPALTLYSFNKANFTKELGVNLLIFLGIITLVQLVFIGGFYLIFRKKMSDVRYRITTVATTLSNCSFLGVPLLEAIFPNSPNVAVYSMMYFLSMSLLGWTLVSAIITRDRKYISVKKILLNPATLSIAVSLPFFFTGFKISADNGQLLGQIENMINILGKMTTPLCMLVMGMRLATIKFKSLFSNWMQYFAVVVKWFFHFAYWACLCFLAWTKNSSGVCLLCARVLSPQSFKIMRRYLAKDRIPRLIWYCLAQLHQS